MKKIIYSIIALIAVVISAHAQPMMVYDLQSTSGTYSEITGGTVMPKLIADTLNSVVFTGDGTYSTSDVTAKGFPIGFNFKYDSKYMTHFMIGSNGYILLGDTAITASTPSSFFHAIGGGYDINSIGAISITDVLGTDSTEISYKMIGEAPDRILVVQYKNLGVKTSRWGEGQTTTQLQIRLHETTGKVEIVFKDWYPNNADMSNISLKIGVKGEDEDRLLVKSSNYKTVTGSTSSSTLISWSNTCYPADGLTYTFTPPAECEAPASQPTNLKYASTSIQITGSFTKTTAADHYLVLLSDKSSLNVLPTDGKMYTAGDSIGDAVVLGYTTDSTFTSNTNLKGATSYHVYVMGANSYCMFGPKYLTASPLTTAIVTMAEKPSSLTADADLTSIKLAVKANTNGNKVIVAMTDQPLYNSSEQMLGDGLFGQPSGKLAVGDSIVGGGKVVYVGAATDNIALTGLPENTVQHFEAWSLDDNGNYSTEGALANTATGGTVPYAPDFTKTSPYDTPTGWTASGSFTLAQVRDGYYYLSSTVTKKDALNGVVNSIVSPWVQLGSGINRVVMDVNFTIYENWSTSVYNSWVDGDSLNVQASTDGVNFTTIYGMGKNDAPKMVTTDDYKTIYAAFDKFAGQKVKFRFYWKTFSSPTLKIKSIRFEEKKDCDYPIDVHAVDSTVIGDKVGVDWTRQGNENEWELRYKKSDDSTWTEPLDIVAKPFTLSGLESVTNYDVQLRAKCDATHHSDWSQTCTFRSGYAVPFSESFGETALPSGWNFKVGALADPTVFDSTAESQWTWYNSFRLKGLYIYKNGETTSNDWLISPSIDLGDGSVNYLFNYTLTYASKGNSTDETYRIVVSKDNGATFSANDTIAKFVKSDLPTKGSKSFQASLKGYKGLVKVGIYVKATDGTIMSYKLANVSVTESCPSDISGIALSDTTENSVKASWTTGADSSYVFIRKAGETTKPYEKVLTPTKEFTGLSPRTDYEIGITKMCEVGDTAKVTIVKFTTLAGVSCQAPENIVVTPAKYSVKISWKGEASKYNIRYRNPDDESGEWIIKTVSDTTATISGLAQATLYQYGLQSVCSTAAGDTSAWTADVFTTLTETCYPPTDIKITPTYKSAVVTWTGEAAKYEINYRKSDDAAWTSEIVAGVNTDTIKNLTATTDYDLRIRSICAVGDSSQWSTMSVFTTTAIPECVTPTNLAVNDVTSTSATLSWTADASNLTWDVHYRKSDVSKWTTVNALTEKSYALTGLAENSAYIWSVMATCEESRTSKWANQNKFSTTATGISNVDISDLSVFAQGKVLNVVNPANGYVKTIQIFNMAGQMLGTYRVNTSDNVFITLNHVSGEVVVKVIGAKTTKIAKLIIK